MLRTILEKGPFALGCAMLALSACAATPGDPQPRAEDLSLSDLGRLDLALTATGPTTSRYRLVQADFSLDDGTTVDQVSSDDVSPDAFSLIVDLTPGDYTITLQPGWVLEKEDAATGSYASVPADLLTPQVNATITAGQLSQAIFRFQTVDDTIGFGQAEVIVAVDQTGNCPSGYTNCGAGCVNFAASPTHCGACGLACGVPHAASVCAGGNCVLNACEPGWDDCDGTTQNGCETNLSTSSAHCGACGASCWASETCQNGACVASPCGAGLADCDGSPQNGCEVTLASDENHCGGCGNRCAGGETCNAGACEPQAVSCPAGRADCDGNPANGCEVNLDTSRSNCGACGNACGSFLFWSLSCRSGSCAL